MARGMKTTAKKTTAKKSPANKMVNGGKSSTMKKTVSKPKKMQRGGPAKMPSKPSDESISKPSEMKDASFKRGPRRDGNLPIWYDKTGKVTYNPNTDTIWYDIKTSEQTVSRPKEWHTIKKEDNKKKNGGSISNRKK
jgi:hypothetical protein